MKTAYQISRAVAAMIMLQTLYFKFGGHPDSIHIFTTLGVEPWGRLATGALEFMASVFLFIPRFTLYAALLALALMIGAILSHFAFLGIDVNNDGGMLFLLALTTFFCSTYVAFYKLTFAKQSIN